MYRRYLPCLLVCVILFFASSTMVAGILPNPFAKDPTLNSIIVQFKGRLSVAYKIKPGFRPQDDEGSELISATVSVGGTQVDLDWSRSEKIRDELLWWRIFRHGDIRAVQAKVTGKMVFRPRKEVGGAWSARSGLTGESLVPVVIVETLRIQLVGVDGKPSGSQFDRLPVSAD